MSSCGVCGGTISRTVIPHGVICEDDTKAPAMPYAPEIDDLIRQQEEEKANE